MDVDRLLDPEVAAVLAGMPAGPGSVTAETLAAFRDFEFPAVDPSPTVARTIVEVPGPQGSPDVPVRLHRRADGSTGHPAVVWAHGGGYVLGNATMDDARLDRWCTTWGLVGVSVEYRLAPEAPYPAPLEDCYAALRWVHDHADELGIDTARIGIGGVSAGGGLAAALGLLARDRGEVPVAFQCLIYPMIDDRFGNASHAWEVPIWPPSSNRFGWSSYHAGLEGDPPVHAAPSRADDLAGLPPAIVVVGSLDGFLDEDVDYAMRLNRAGVPTELHVYPGACHGFDGMAPTSGIARQLRDDVDRWMARAIGATAG